ncbi:MULTISPECIES: cell envelope integrity protein TolA [Burkholderia]|uniref:Energy transducer TonB n=1 Tax=Burkholderia cenocepacia TaxID=95486 RepID=A0A071MGF0_9BURK|nr:MULTISPECIES: cell envelope integrity protein TolA [Burkholderia]MBN3741113.1 cell envelope integrity protein TolA [Burkholderia sp. Tr-20355]MCA8431657.1 cell envelope integrity protein TolA [Burkholderia seminalis]QTO19398.1 cell envelope integrity protein TolA [Burkholderia seminalis]RQS83552.1 cell envelope integrity protein TolA [Burkholderia seminalis]RQS99764.1 cell envelope integrity protein TolA [Burkholderia seminalis]
MNRQQSTRSAAYPPQPPRERGTWRAFALAALMHVLLALFLYHGVQWQNSTPAGAEAELWTEVPDVPAPRPVVTPAPPAKVAPPAPPVRDEQADIALQQKKRQQEAAAREALLEQQRRAQQLKQQEEEARRAQLAAQQAAALAAEKAAERDKQKQAAKLKQQQLAEQQKLEQQKLEQQKLQQQKQAQLEAQQAAKAKADAAAKAKAEAQAKAKAEAAAHAKADAAAKAKLDRERNARLAQMQGLAGAGEGGGQGLAKSGTGTGSGGNAASPGYADKVRRRVKPNIVWGGERAGLTTIVKIRCTPSGDLLSVSVSRSSGNSGWDQAVVNAIQASVPLPPDTDGHTPSSITITFKAAE